MSSSLKQKFIKGIIWSFVGQGGYLLIALFANFFLARLLTPLEFGQVGIVMFFIIVSKVLTESGLSGALIRKNDATEEDFSTVFIFNLVVSIFLCLLLCLFSGYIAAYYNDDKLQFILIALSSILVINSFQFTQNVKIIKELRFRQQSIYAFVSIIISSLLGVTLGYLGYGVWAIVVMQICNAFVLTAIYWIFEGPVKCFVFNKQSFRSLYKFGMNTTISSLIDTAFDNVYNLILGKYFSIQQTGLYYQAKKLQEIPVGVIKSSTLGVVFSTLSKLQDNKEKFDLFYNKIVSVFTVFVGLICVLVYFFAEQAVLLLYGNQWINSVFFVKVLIIPSFFYMQEMLNRILFKVFDRTDKILYLEILKKTIQTLTIIIGLLYSDIELLLYGFVITSVVSYFINYYHSRKVYKSFSWVEIMVTLKVVIVSILVVAVFSIIKNSFSIEQYKTLLLLPLIVMFYLGIIHLLKVITIKDFRELLKLIKNR